MVFSESKLSGCGDCMNKKIVRKLLVAVIPMLMVSCASKAPEVSLFPEFDVAEIDSLTKISDSLSRATSSQLTVVNGALLTTRQEITEIKEMQDNMSPGRIEELEVQLVLLVEAFKDLYATVAAIKVMPQIRYAPVKAKRAKGFVVSTSTAMYNSDEYELYSRALESYRKKFYAESRQLLIAQTEKFPKGRLIDRAYYWIGETHFSEKEYSLAITSFEKVANFSGGSKDDDALYKQALAYYRLGENDMSRELFKKLIARFPGSEYVKRSKVYINKAAL
jgi:TolA-binding protein